MGLDMYLSARQYVSRIDFSKGFDEKDGWTDNPSFDRLVEVMDAGDMIEPEPMGIHVDIPVAYWRKANAIHKWFVDVHADGEDNCQQIEVPLEGIEELIELCKQVRDNKDKADELLPTESGFFFGSTEMDDWYWDYIEYTIERLTDVVQGMKKRGISWCVYQASW